MLSKVQLSRRYNKLAIKAARALERKNLKLYKAISRQLSSLILQVG